MDAITSVKKNWSCRCPISWKLAVLESIVYSRLTYRVETLQLNTNHLSRLDACQQKCLRRILNIPPTFIDRTWSNSRVLEVACHHRPQATVSAVLQTRKLKLIRHLLRSQVNDVLRCSVISSNNVLATPALRRPGRPRHHWTVLGVKTAWTCSGKDPTEFVANTMQINFLYSQAIQRNGIFG